MFSSKAAVPRSTFSMVDFSFIDRVESNKIVLATPLPECNSELIVSTVEVKLFRSWFALFSKACISLTALRSSFAMDVSVSSVANVPEPSDASFRVWTAFLQTDLHFQWSHSIYTRNVKDYPQAYYRLIIYLIGCWN